MSHQNDKLNIDMVEKFYSALLKELDNAGYNSQEKELMGSMRLYYGRYIDPNKRSYFEQRVIPYVANAIAYFQLKDKANQCVLDLGCGLGMQSLIFAKYGCTCHRC